MSEVVQKKSKRCSDEEAMSARREEILETATELFAEQGFSDAVTQVLADRLQIGKGTLYRHFPSKRELFLAAADRVMVQAQRADRVAASPASTTGWSAWREAISTYLAFFAENPRFVELIIQERANFKDRKRPTYFEHRERTFERWRQLYRDIDRARAGFARCPSSRSPTWSAARSTARCSSIISRVRPSRRTFRPRKSSTSSFGGS